MATDITHSLWRKRAWSAITKVLQHENHDFTAETNPLAEHLWNKVLAVEYPHTYEEYLDVVMTVIHKESESLERAKLAVRALRFSKVHN